MILVIVVQEKNSSSVMEDCNVVVGIIINNKNEVLIALRPLHVVQPGVWEFPGGKVEPNETLENALIREFFEEIGIAIKRAEFFLKIEKSFPEKNILLILHAFRIHDYTGVPYGRENQQIQWVSIDNLTKYTFPEANSDIVFALQAQKS